MSETKSSKQKWYNFSREKMQWHPTVNLNMYCKGIRPNEKGIFQINYFK